MFTYQISHFIFYLQEIFRSGWTTYENVRCWSLSSCYGIVQIPAPAMSWHPGAGAASNCECHQVFIWYKSPMTNPSTLKPSRCIKASFYIPEIRPNFPTTKGFRMKISMKLVYQYMAIFITFSPTSNHLHPLQVENCDSNSRLVVDEDDSGKLRLERVNRQIIELEFKTINY